MRNKQVNLKKGTTILTEQPFVYALKSKYRTERCDYCLANTDKLLKCSNCRYVYYCGKECQKDAWSIHQMECKSLKAVAPRIVPDAARVMARIVWRLKRGGDLVKGYYTPSCFRKFRDLMSHYVDLKRDAKRLEHFESLSVVLNELLGDTVIPNSTELLGIYGRLCVNGFSISNGEMNSIATGLYLGASIIDHSCKPNAVAIFDGTTISIRLIEDLPVLDLTKVFISYIDVMNSANDRREELSKSYYFNCLCPKCSIPLESTTMDAAACPNPNCDEPFDMQLNECSKCEEIMTQERRDEFRTVCEFTKQKLYEMKDIAYLDVCKICLAKHKNLLHPNNYLHLKTLDSSFESAIEMEKWGEALKYGTALLPGFQKYHGDYSPLLGVMCLKLGKLQLYMNRQRDALATLKEAAKIIKITHGEFHILYKKDLIPLMYQASVEN